MCFIIYRLNLHKLNLYTNYNKFLYVVTDSIIRDNIAEIK